MRFGVSWLKNESNQLSAERQNYLKRKKRNRNLVRVTQLGILVVLIALWEILADIGVIDSFIMSSPSRILKTFGNLSNNGILTHLGVTLYETLTGFFLGVILGIIIAIILWWSKFLSKVSEPFLVVLNSLPKIALGPVIIIWVGAGTGAIVFMAVAISLIVTVLEMLNGFRSTNPEMIRMAQSFSASKAQIFTKIVFPSNLHTLFNSLKVNIGLSLVGVIAGEFLVSKAGLGYLIVYGGQVFKLDLVMASVIILAIVAAVLYEVVVLGEKLVNHFVSHR
ncbi:ABC transporter permease [Clostridium sp. NSJ-27]|uniref:ABC transporter permease n=1 Tax=Clostridium facile TaxID=2763035 RepID=A0ABR7ITF0_9CLOT|nr:ABC transporter permease [Clostridium facile]